MLWLVVLSFLSMVQADMKGILSSNCTDVPEINAVLPFNSSWADEDTGKFYEYAYSGTSDTKCNVGMWVEDESIKCQQSKCYKYTLKYINTTSNKEESKESYFMIYPDKNLDTYVAIQTNGLSYPSSQIPIVARTIYKNETETNTVYIDYGVDLGCTAYWVLFGRRQILSDDDYKSAMLALDHFKLNKSTMTNFIQDCKALH